MRLVDDWKWVVTKAYSFRLIALSAVLSGIDAAVQYVAPAQASWRFAAAAGIISAAAALYRLKAQRQQPSEVTRGD